MGLTNPHPDYEAFKDSWQLCRDVAEGALCVKRKGSKYLPKGRMTDNDYADYLYRAEFVGYVGKILDFSAGQLNRNPAQTSGIPEEILNDVDLCGNSLSAFINHMARELMTVERIGLWCDYSVEKQRPYMVTVKAENIIKWHYGYVSTGEKVLTSVVLKTEEETFDAATCDSTKEVRYIVLRLNENGYFQKDTYAEDNKAKDGVRCLDADPVIPVAGIKGEPLTFIPFAIVSAQGTPERVHTAPMYPVADVNLSLYRSMASREQLLFYYGMPTGIAKGWPQNTPFPIGGVAAFDIGGDFSFAQIQVDDAIDRAIQSKKDEIAQLGSSFLSGRGKYVASATTADINQEGDNASLATLANTISRALTEAFGRMTIYAYDGLEAPSIKVNTEFEEPELSQGELTELGQEVAAGRMSFDVYYYNLERNKMYPSGWTLEQELAALKTTAQNIASNRTEIPGYSF